MDSSSGDEADPFSNMDQIQNQRATIDRKQENSSKLPPTPSKQATTTPKTVGNPFAKSSTLTSQPTLTTPKTQARPSQLPTVGTMDSSSGDEADPFSNMDKIRKQRVTEKTNAPVTPSKSALQNPFSQQSTMKSAKTAGRPSLLPAVGQNDTDSDEDLFENMDKHQTNRQTMDRLQEGVKFLPSTPSKHKVEQPKLDFFDIIEEDDKTDSEIIVLQQELKKLKQSESNYELNLQEQKIKLDRLAQQTHSQNNQNREEEIEFNNELQKVIEEQTKVINKVKLEQQQQELQAVEQAQKKSVEVDELKSQIDLIVTSRLELESKLNNVTLLLAQEQANLEQLQVEMMSSAVNQNGGDQVLSKQILEVKMEIMEKQSLLDQLVKQSEQLDQQLKSVFLRLPEMEEEGEDDFSKIEKLYRARDVIQKELLRNQALHDVFRIDTAVLRKKVNDKNNLFRHLKKYEEEFDEQIDSSVKQSKYLKEFGVIKAKLSEFLSYAEWETKTENQSIDVCLQEKDEVMHKITEKQQQIEDCDRSILKMNAILPEEGVILKQVTAEIYQLKIEIQATQREQDSLENKYQSLTDQLIQENFKSNANDNDIQINLTQKQQQLTATIVQVELRLQQTQKDLIFLQQENRNLIQTGKSLLFENDHNKQENMDLNQSRNQVNQSEDSIKIQNISTYSGECDETIQDASSQIISLRTFRRRQIDEALKLRKGGIQWVNYAEQISDEILKNQAEVDFDPNQTNDNEDEFDIDKLIEERKSERKSRSSSGSRSSSSDPNSPQTPSEFLVKENARIRQKWAAPTLRHIDEQSDEYMTSEYGSEVGFDRKTPRGEGSLASRLKAAAIRHSSQAATESAPLSRPTENFRPSIFDMQRRTSTQGGFRATLYDKSTARRSIAQNNTNQDETVLSDLIVCLLSKQSMLMTNSDFEFNQGFSLFSNMLKADPKCHEAMFGLGRINYIQGRYEIAEKWLIKAYETQRDFAYRVWLGFTQYQLYKVCTDDNPKKLKFATNAFQNLERCSRESKVGLYANFGLLEMSLELGQQIKGMQEPINYAVLIKSEFNLQRFEGTLALALINLRTKQEASGLKSLVELTSAGRSLAYFVVIRHYLSKSDFGVACQKAEEATKKMANFESFNERLTLTFLLCKCLAKTGQLDRLLLTLQMQYTESPHFSSLLYLYGKYIVKNPTLHSVHLAAGMSALQEVCRISCQVRQAKASYWLSVAYQENGQLTQAGIHQGKYLSSIRQVVKIGSVKQKQIMERVDVSVQLQVIQAVDKLKYPNINFVSKEKNDMMFASPQDGLDGQGLEQSFIPDSDFVIACMRIANHRDQQLYKAIALYRLKNEVSKADILFQNLLKEYQTDVEVRVENIKFLKHVIRDKRPDLKRSLTPLQELNNFLDILKQLQVPGDLWASSLSECAKLLNILCQLQGNSTELMMKAFECLLQLKQVLPVIDTKLAGIKLPANAERFLFDEFDHIDFQALETKGISDESDDEFSFKPQQEFDHSNKFFIQSQYMHLKIQNYPLASLSMAEIRDQTRVKDETVFFFGAAQTELAYAAEEVSKQINEKITSSYTPRKYYKSSTPLIAVIKYLSHLRRVNMGASYIEEPLIPSTVRDAGFCVRSDPTFLYKIAKMCLQNQVFIDLAVQCLLVYQQVMSYYKSYNDWSVKQIRAKILLALVLKQMSTNIEEDKHMIDKIVKEETPALKRAYDLTSYNPKAKLSLIDFQQLKSFKLLQKL